MSRVLLYFYAVLSLGCAISGYEQFYYPVSGTSNYDSFPIILLEEGQEPEVIVSNDVERDGKILISKHYAPIGYSSFNGPYEDTKSALDQAKKIGATVVLISSEYTETVTSTGTLYLPQTQTVYTSGTVNSNSQIYGGINGPTNANSTGTINTTSTVSTTQAVPYSRSTRRYDQSAYYFAKQVREGDFGLSVRDLSPDQRQLYGRNTGVYVDVVYEDSPAFDSNFLPEDVVIRISGNQVRNVEHLVEVLAALPGGFDGIVFSVLRNGKEITLTANEDRENGLREGAAPMP